MTIFLRRILLLVLLPALLIGFAARAVAAEATIIVDAQTGFILEKVQAEKKRQVGSLTKIATAMVVLDWSAKEGGDLNQVAVIPPAAFGGTSENNIGFQPGDTVTLRDLLYAALVQSDNIAAYDMAAHVGAPLRSLVPLPAGAKLTAADPGVRETNAPAQH